MPAIILPRLIKGVCWNRFFVVTSASFQNAGDLIALIVLSCCFTAVALQSCHSCKEKTTATRRCRAAYNFTALNLLQTAAADEATKDYKAVTLSFTFSLAADGKELHCGAECGE